MKKSKLFYSLMAVFALSIASSANALDLQTARAQGVIVEQPDGYVRVAISSAEAQKLAGEVNAGRKAEYEKISKANGQSVDVVAKVAAETIAKNQGK